MEFKKAIYETHFRNVSSVAINSARRELFTGSDGMLIINLIYFLDGSIKTWDSETVNLYI